jgi:hypothetical protein
MRLALEVLSWCVAFSFAVSLVAPLATFVVVGMRWLHCAIFKRQAISPATLRH